MRWLFISDSDENVQQDPEIQAFREELILPRAMDGTGGCGMNVCLKLAFPNVSWARYK